jgi:hypothetical protein
MKNKGTESPTNYSFLLVSPYRILLIVFAMCKTLGQPVCVIELESEPHNLQWTSIAS